ncbi:MAG: Coenzyme F420 hydrogenase/dehydrogenase, beta subunit C-terminal domain [Victivallaceae bacterium]|nr:Coenzyme F420 hydrogenase/dehydrogenase, beta subunit C-terminal domain [Victivallaceae bacterium]
MKITRSNIFEIGKYTLGCGLGALLKIALNCVLTFLGVSLAASYLVVQVVILFASFLYHFKITFGRQFDSLRTVFNAFRLYVPSVILFKLTDYLLVVCSAGALKEYLSSQTTLSLCTRQIVNTGCILLASAIIFALRYFIYRCIFVKRSAEDLDYYTGKVKSVFTGYASNLDIAKNAASGGFVSRLLVELLNKKQIDGAVVARFRIAGGKPEAGAVIATSAEEILKSQGSIYINFPLLSAQTISDIRSFPGKLAVVALPCQCAALRKLMDRDPELAARVALVVGLFCGHTSRPELLNRVLEKKGVDIADVADYRFRRGLGRGTAVVTMKDGSQRSWPTAFYTLYQNLFIESAPQCLHCFDHFAEQADVSCGDIWTWAHRKDRIKHSIFCPRTAIGEKAVRDAIAGGTLIAQEVDQNALLKSNIRAAVYHKAIRARSEVAKKYGLEISVPDTARPSRWNERLAAKIVFKLSRVPAARIFSMSRRRLKVLLYAFKGLTNF